MLGFIKFFNIYWMDKMIFFILPTDGIYSIA